MKPDGFSNLILVFGLPRSGTTWIAKFFDSHPDTVYRHEPDRYQKLDVPAFAVPEMADHYRDQIRDFAHRMMEMRSYRVCAKLPLFRKSYISGVQFHLYRLSAYLSKIHGRVYADSKLVYVPKPADLSNIRITWKSINSVGRIGLISKILSDCKPLLIIRHPCGQINSQLKGDDLKRSQGRTPLSEDWRFFEMLLDTDVARGYRLSMEKMKSLTREERFAWQWVIINEKAINELADRENHIVSYDHVCVDPQGAVRRMFDHVDLGVSDQTLGFLRRSTHEHKGSYFSVYKDPKDSANKWKQQLSLDQIDRITTITADTPPWGYVSLGSS